MIFLSIVMAHSTYNNGLWGIKGVWKEDILLKTQGIESLELIL